MNKRRALILLPVSYFSKLASSVKKKISINTFSSGLASGVLFGLVVNVLTIQIQEKITRQQYLEALEFEIMGHFTQSSSSLDTINEMRKSNSPANSYLFKKRFDTNVWNSGAALGYIYTIEPETQAKLSTYYSHTINPSNNNIDKMDKAMDALETKLADCIISNESCDKQAANFYQSPFFYENFYVLQNEQVSSSSADLLKTFQPTNERLYDPILRILMGKKSLPILGSPRQ